MTIVGTPHQQANLESVGIKNPKTIYWNITPAELIEQTILRGQGQITDTGALSIHTGAFTGRTPKDRFIVKDDFTADHCDWGTVNQPFDGSKYDALKAGLVAYFADKDVFVRDNFVCADEDYRLYVRTITEYPWSNLFADNMFLRPKQEQLPTLKTNWVIINAPGYQCPNPKDFGLNRGNFVVMDFTRREILIGGTGYTGEIKKGIFAVLNLELPVRKNVLPMHCSANVDDAGKTAIFFGLSGTGKTTLSADPNRHLIGDDEHGWSNAGVFNFEGGCYAKTINISEDTEPEIFRAIKHGAILENIKFIDNTRTPDYTSKEITENTRVSYPINFIPNIQVPSKAGHPTDIFFLTCDAFGVLPPISKLTTGQAMYHFISGYTSKVPGTEDGVAVPQPTFSACFGAPFMPLHPSVYAEMLGVMMEKHQVNVWLLNTGWSGGGFGVGSRIKLRYTRAMITAALKGELNDVTHKMHAVFGLNMITTCPGVPSELLNPRNTWASKNAYDAKANEMAESFNKNFAKFADKCSQDILDAAPKAIIPA